MVSFWQNVIDDGDEIIVLRVLTVDMSGKVDTRIPWTL